MSINFHIVHKYQDIWRGYTDSIPTDPIKKEKTPWEKNHKNFRKFFHIHKESDGRYYVEEILEYDFLLRVTVNHTWRNYTENIKVDNFSFDSLEELLGFFRMKDIELKGGLDILLKCPQCKKSIHQKYGAWSNKEPRISKRAYDCPRCKTRFIETVDVGSCQVLSVESVSVNSVRECLDEWL